LEIPYDSFRSEVVPFLDPDVATLYDEATWEQMRTSVATSLDELAGAAGGDQ
jgi:hypothetical protein